jgi:hypothetical protein
MVVSLEGGASVDATGPAFQPTTAVSTFGGMMLSAAALEQSGTSVTFQSGNMGDVFSHF